MSDERRQEEYGAGCNDPSGQPVQQSEIQEVMDYETIGYTQPDLVSRRWKRVGADVSAESGDR